MKTMKRMTFMLVLLMAGFIANAEAGVGASQDNTPIEDFFIGKWKLMFEDLPQGDGTMLLTVKKADGKLTGTIGEGTSQQTEVKKIEIEKETMYVTFIGAGHEVVIELEKQKDGTVVGNLNDMFEATGKKIVD